MFIDMFKIARYTGPYSQPDESMIFLHILGFRDAC